MQRTVYDQTVTPGQARRLEPALAEQYPSRTHVVTAVPFRTPNDLKRVRLVVQLKPRRRRR